MQLNFLFDNGSQKPIDRTICLILKFITGIWVPNVLCN